LKKLEKKNQNFIKLVTAMNKRFHAHHFNCTACKKSLIGEPFYDKGDKPYCGPCSNLI